MSEISVLNKKLKKILKQKKITYRQLADELEMSESGVKKLLSGKDYSLNKLIRITKILNIDIDHLFQSLKDKEEKTNLVLAQGHEEFFLKNWDYFCFYWVLVFEGWPLRTIMEKYNLPLDRAQKYLRKLDKLDLIEYHSDDKIKFPDSHNISFKGTNELEKKILVDWPLQLFKETKETWDKHDDPVYYILWSKMSKETYKEFKIELKNLLSAYNKRGYYDTDSGKADLTMVKMALSMDTGSFVKIGDI